MAIHLMAIGHGATQETGRADTPAAVAYGGTILCWLLSAGVYIAAKWVSPEMPPWTLCFWRLSLACAILLPIVRHHFAEMRDLVSARPFELAIVGGIGLTLCQGLIYTGLQYTSATTAGIVMALCPIFTLVLAHLVLGEAMGMWQVVGAALSFAGMLVIVARGDLAALVHLQLNPGELLVVISALCWGLYTVLLKRLKFGIARLPLLVLLLGMGALIALPLYLWELVNDERSTLDTAGMLALAYVAAPGGAFMYFLYNWTVETLGASRAGLFLYLQTAFVAILAYLILGERLHGYDWAGAAIIVAGLVCAMALGPKPAAPQAAVPRA